MYPTVSERKLHVHSHQKVISRWLVKVYPVSKYGKFKQIVKLEFNITWFFKMVDNGGGNLEIRYDINRHSFINSNELKAFMLKSHFTTEC